MNERMTVAASLEAASNFTQGFEVRLQALPVEARTAVTLAVHELLVNIVEHAYAGLPGDIVLEYVLDDAAIRLVVTDRADNHFTMPDVVAPPDPLDLPEGGMGLFIIHQAFDVVRYEPLPQGNRWQLIKQLGE